MSFFSWLEGRLKFTGPLHYTDRMIGRALQKTPAAVQNMFIWLLGAFRCLNDSRRFKLVGPFMCLPNVSSFFFPTDYVRQESILFQQSWCAEDKCIALGFPVEDWYKEEWETMTPNQICSSKALIK